MSETNSGIDPLAETLEPSSPAPSASAIANPRAAARVSVEFFLRQIESISAVMQGDFFLGIVLTVIGSANVRPITRSPELSRTYGAIDQPPPDDIKIPITVSALAASLGLPYETTRRYVGRLHDMGLIRKVKGGWITPALFAGSPPSAAIIERGMANLRQFILALRGAGVDIDQIR